MMILKPDRSVVKRKSMKKLPMKPYKFMTRVDTNYKFGISKDFPFPSQYTEFHTLTKTMVPGLEPEYKQRINQVGILPLELKGNNGVWECRGGRGYEGFLES